MVDVVIPLRRDPLPARIGGRDDPGVVEVALGDQVERSAQLPCESVDAIGQFGQEVPG